MRAEIDALVDLLEQAGIVYVGDAEGPPPYLRVVPQRNPDEQARLTGPRATEAIQVAVGAVGETPVQAMWLDERVDAILRPRGVGVRLVVPGRSCSPVERRASDMSADDSAGRVWQVVSSYRLESRPA